MKGYAVMVIIIWFSRGSTLNECQPCQCCNYGAGHCIFYNNTQDYCFSGCIDGYLRPKCTHSCRDNCLKCKELWTCDKCQDGYYGKWCNKCPFGCETCSDWSNCDVCRNGYYNGKQYIFNSVYETTTCQFACPASCKTCSSFHTCNECKSGFSIQSIYNYEKEMWYKTCDPICDSGCNCSSKSLCTDCLNGYYHATEFCHKCNENCTSCLSQQTCTACIDGKYNQYFNDCREFCKQECKSCTSYDNCAACVRGRYGTSCEHYCNHGCLNGDCNKNSGHCDCKTGFTGEKCDKCNNYKYGTNCEKNCPRNCLARMCDSNGHCLKCKTGFLGNKCEKCQVGLYGQNCDINCPSGCANNNCTTEGVCYSCKSGKYGKECTGSCSIGCDLESCFDNGDCPKCRKWFTGRKCDQCIDGKFGENCGLNCSTTCLACYSLTNCSACVKKHWGNSCQQCPTNCLNCSSNNICSLCVKGYYGQICNEQCNVNCLDGHCNQLYGNCSEGCVDGFYGEACDLKCSPYCANSICGRENGNCLHGCKAGHNGTKCSQTLELKEEGNGDMNVVIGATAGGVLILIVILVIVITIILIKRRRRGDKQDNNNKGTKTEDANMTYSEINDINMTAENNHTDDIETERENINYSEIQDAVLSTKSQESDNVYAKPIKPKRKTEGVKSLNKTSTEVTVNNPTYEKPDTSQTETVKTNKIKKPPIASKPAKKYDNNVIPRPTGMQATSNVSHIQNDAALEIEEDIDRLSSRSKSVFLEEQKAAELDNVDTYYNVAAVIKRKITIDKLPEFVAKKTKKDFVDEFQSLPAMLIKPYVDSQKRENRSKNRYKGIYPYDDTRVVLKESDSDYINASYTDGYNKNKAYIASIGPTFKYMGDMSAFWIMVWQENVGKIVMLTNLEEGGVPKCDQYWPEKDFSLMFANIQVTCHTEENYADYTFRSFSVQKDSIKREIVQVHFTAWPDKGTPDDVTSLIEFRQKVNSTKTKLDCPILVHCSAGIGRTGTYIALDSITNEGEAEGAVDIYAFVRNMREQRVNMIQTAEQYQYLHNAIIHTLTFDSKAVKASVFNDYMKTHTEVHLGNMFEKLQASVEQRSDDEQEGVKRNKTLVNKNRNGADIPGDSNRPLLFRAKTPGQSDYINAVYVNSFKNVNRFLIAQTPLPDTVEDFLTLIVQEKVSCVISMETTSSENKDIGIYCPADNQTLRKGAFTIKTERGDGTDQYHLKKMKISYKSKSGSEEVIVPHVQYTQWDNNMSIPEEPVKFVQFVKDMELKFSGTDTNRPMLVHCLTGAKKGGLFCVVSTLLEKTQIDQEVSVANTVRQIKYRRHLAIPDKEQYIFCHHCVNEYLRTFDIYSNFELKT